MYDIITFGSAVVDVFVDTDVEDQKGYVSYPVGSKMLIRDLRFDVGGGGTNTAVAFSRLGFKTAYLGKLGEDADAERIIDFLKKEKVTFIGNKDKKHQTGYSVVLDSDASDRTILTFKGASDHLKFSEINLGKIKTKWLYFSSVLNESYETQIKLASILHKKGVKIVFNPSEYLIKEKDVSKIVKFCEVLVLNKEEAKLLAGKNDPLKFIHGLGARKVVITDKDNVVVAYDGIKKHSITPHKIKVVERTGAGDAFASGFVAGQMIGLDMDKSLELGLREGESVLTQKGGKHKLLRMRLK
ncbi:MAG TPA: carbohydrate kinase family protein [Candidatus Nanoarchaeia archaeon]|nr:carbohydrate kinase family protein [Candidatus Nanoarchaeia archaeon]